MKIFKQFFSSLIILLLIFSCSLPRVYEVVVSQGNLIDEDMMEKLEVGMTESQVKYVLGSPLIIDTFAPNRWDYYTSVTQGNKKFTEKKITLYFLECKFRLLNLIHIKEGRLDLRQCHENLLHQNLYLIHFLFFLLNLRISFGQFYKLRLVLA